MENKKINIAELLKDCPKGMELDCTMYDNVTLIQVQEDNTYPIKIETPDGSTVLTKYGGVSYNKLSKCIIFPKGETNWEGFHKPFKDGDILVSGLGDCEEIPFIFKQINRFGNAECYCAINCYGELIFNSDNWTYIKGCRFATEEEKQKLFDAIKDNDYKWNAETKTLEKLVKPKFKVGDIIRDITGICKVKIAEVNVENRYYLYKSLNINGIGIITFNRQDDWELVPNKFDINNLKPFDKVLVRSDNSDIWECDFFSLYNPKCSNRFHCIGAWYNICIPYIGNEHLFGTTDDCDDFYKTWE